MRWILSTCSSCRRQEHSCWTETVKMFLCSHIHTCIHTYKYIHTYIHTYSRGGWSERSSGLHLRICGRISIIVGGFTAKNGGHSRSKVNTLCMYVCMYEDLSAFKTLSLCMYVQYVFWYIRYAVSFIN